MSNVDVVKHRSREPMGSQHAFSHDFLDAFDVTPNLPCPCVNVFVEGIWKGSGRRDSVVLQNSHDRGLCEKSNVRADDELL